MTSHGCRRLQCPVWQHVRWLRQNTVLASHINLHLVLYIIVIHVFQLWVFVVGRLAVGLGSSVNLSINGLWLRNVSGGFHRSCVKLHQAVGGGWRRT